MSLPALSERLAILGKRLRTKRLALNKTVQDVAFDADITQTYLWMLENPKPTKSSRPSADVLARIARALSFSQVEFGELLDLAGHELLAVAALPENHTGHNGHNGDSVGAGERLRDEAEPPPLATGRHLAPQDLWMLVPPTPWVGRDDELRWVVERLCAGGPGTITAISGMAGIGKSALAAVALQRAADRFADGVAVVVCRDMGSARDVLRRVVERFMPDAAASDSPSTDMIQDTAFRLLQGKRALIVLDDVESSLDITGIIPPLCAAGVSLLLTSREILSRELIPVDASRHLEPLPPDDALDLFALALGRRSRGDLQALDAESARSIVASLGYHTLAIKLAGTYAADARRDLATLAEELNEPGAALQLPTSDERRRLEPMLRKSADALDPPTHQLFAALSILSPDFGRGAVVALAAGLGIPAAQINELVRRALLTPVQQRDMPPRTERERLRLHPLLHSLTKEAYDALEREQQDRIGTCVALYYMQYVEKVWSQFRQSTERNAVLDVDAPNIERAIEEAYRLEDHASVVMLCAGMRYYWQDGWRIPNSLSRLARGIESAQRIAGESASDANRLALIRLQLAYGRALRRTGDLDHAQQAFERALEYSQEAGDEACEAKAIHELGQLARRRAKLPDAEHLFEASLHLRERTHDVRGEGADLGYLARIALQQGKVAAAEERSRQSLQLARTAGDRGGEAAALYQFGQIALARGQTTNAATHFGESLQIFRDLHDVQAESSVLSQLGRIALERARLSTDSPQRRSSLDEAETYTQQALSLGGSLQDVWGGTVNLTQLGRIALERGQLNGAERLFRDSLAMSGQAQDRWNTGVNRALLGRVALERVFACSNAEERGRLLDDAEHHIAEALRLAEDIPNRRGKGVNLAQLARVAYARGRLDVALQRYSEGLWILDDVGDVINFVEQSLAYGRFLVETDRFKAAECALILKAVHLCAQIAPQRESEARQLARRLRCAQEA